MLTVYFLHPQSFSFKHLADGFIQSDLQRIIMNILIYFMLLMVLQYICFLFQSLL